MHMGGVRTALASEGVLDSQLSCRFAVQLAVMFSNFNTSRSGHTRAAAEPARSASQIRRACRQVPLPAIPVPKLDFAHDNHSFMIFSQGELPKAITIFEYR